ncbi:MAG: membrane-binding protein [Bacteroidota bacterium]
MKHSFISTLFIAICLICCLEKESYFTDADANPFTHEIPETYVNKSDLHYDAQRSIWTLNNEAFSGFAVSFYENEILREKLGILKGRKEDSASQWYPDGHYKRIAIYRNGKLEGDKKSWSADSSHLLLSHLRYKIGKLHGRQQVWYPTGQVFKKMNFDMGKEEGLQQAFRKNGALFANYEAKAGRIFGLKKAALCYGLEDEQIQSRSDEKR